MTSKSTQATHDDLEHDAINFLMDTLGWSSIDGRGVFTFDDLPSRKNATDNFGFVDNHDYEGGTLLRLNCHLWSTIDWSRNDVGDQVKTNLRLKSQFLATTSDWSWEKWQERLARPSLRRRR